MTKSVTRKDIIRENNKCIAENTRALYLKMLFSMGVVSVCCKAALFTPSFSI